jgi:hypothetical protein
MERRLQIFEIKQGIKDRKHLGLNHDYFQEGKKMDLPIDRISTGIGCPGVMTILSHELVV